MEYKISHEMAIELIHRYLEKIYILNKHKGTSVVKVQQLYNLNEDLKTLITQLRESGHDTDMIIRGIKQELEKKYLYDKLTVNIDGAARGNNNTEQKNDSAIGFAIFGDSQLLAEDAVYLGSDVSLPRLKNEPSDTPAIKTEATNNTAEYLALIHALEYMLQNGLNANHIEILSDSRMVVTQVNMISTTKAPHLIQLRDCAHQLLDEFDNITLTFIPREQNAYVDGLINELLDKVEEEREAG
jgi:ribonuclease HI